MSMVIIPTIHLYERAIYDKIDGKIIPLDALFDNISSEKKVYIVDHDGLEKDNPNLCLYPKLSDRYAIWVDSGPKTLGDVVDILMAGATAITLRQDIWRGMGVSSIKEITENEVFFYADVLTNTALKPAIETFGQETGTVLFTNNDTSLAEFRVNSYLLKAEKGYKVYIYDAALERISYWKNKKITGLITDLSKWQEFKKYDL